MQAVADAECAAALAPAWPKPLHRLAQALAGLERWAAAMAACRKGAAILGQPPHVYADFALQLDSIAVAAGLQGDLSGFDGRRLEVLRNVRRRSFNVSRNIGSPGQQACVVGHRMQCFSALHKSAGDASAQVRDAGEEAWLGREAPPDPELDLEPDEAPPLMLMPPPPAGEADEQEPAEHGTDGSCSHTVVAGMKSKTARDDSRTCLSNSFTFCAVCAVKRGQSFRSLHAAVAAARDGDIITLRKGTHNGLGRVAASSA